MKKDNQEKLDALRHSAAHLLAAAVLENWPDAKPTIGPSIENGFYYDFDFGDINISDKDLKVIQKSMKKMSNKWLSFERNEIGLDEAKEFFAKNPYKLELIDELASDGETISTYKSGNFIDLCGGGHVDKPNEELKHFKLLSVAGAYWRGSEENKMLTRIYGTAFFTADELADYMNMLEEAKKRDHKKLGKELDLFTFSDLVGSGLALWPPKGAIMRDILDDFVWELRKKRGYQKVEIPHITKRDLYEVSGHWEKFQDDLFKINTREGHEFVMKPMNCPHHTQIFARKPHSYKEMPQRYSNTTMVYRDEQSGELSGLSRVRSITQDDAHVFCQGSQVRDEMNKIWDIIDEFYKAVGFDLYVRLSLSDPDKADAYLGDRKSWEWAEEELRQLAKDRGVEVMEVKGEAAFYGPKLDFMAKDSLGREWQVATNQLDMNMPNRFGLYCINDKGEKEQIYMLHAAIMGSIERYMSILIEHFAGAFPVWLAPVQAIIMPISESHQEYAEKLKNDLEKEGVRVEVWPESDSLQKRIRLSEKQKVPYMLVVGDREVESNSVSVRSRGQLDLGVMETDQFISQITEEIDSKSL